MTVGAVPPKPPKPPTTSPSAAAPAGQGPAAAGPEGQIETGPVVAIDTSGKITSITITNPTPVGNDTAAFTGQTFPLHRSNPQRMGQEVGAAVGALNLDGHILDAQGHRTEPTISGSWGDGRVNVTLTIGADGKIADVTVDTSQFTVSASFPDGATPEEKSQIIAQRTNDFANWVAGRFGNLTFAPATQAQINAGQGEQAVQIPISL